MKKIILIGVLFIATLSYAQKPKVDATGYSEVSEAEKSRFSYKR